jgi:hypothetical protein
MENLQQSQRALGELRREIKELTVSHAQVAQLGDRLQSERTALEGFGDRMAAMSARSLELDAKMSSVLRQLGLVDSGVTRAAELTRQVEIIERQLDAIDARLPVLGTIEGRLEQLDAISASVDARLRDQAARGAEIDGIKATSEALIERVSDAQRRLELVRAAQARLVPMVGDVSRLEEGIAAVAAQITALSRDDAAMVAQERRFAELLDLSREIATDVGDRARDMERLSDALTRAAGEKDALVKALALAQARQGEVVTQTQAIDDQLVRAAALLAQIQERSAEAAVSETRLAAIESRCQDITRLGEDMERCVLFISEREAQVLGVRAEVDGIHAVCERSRADLALLSDRRAEVQQLRASTDALLTQMAETDTRFAALTARQAAIDAVQAKADEVAALLDDVRSAYDLLSERHEVVDQIAEKVAGLEALVQEAQTVADRLQRQPNEQLERKVKRLKVKGARAKSESADLAAVV